MRLGLETLLVRAGFKVVASFATCAEAAERLGDTTCDMVLLDLSLPDASGTEAVQRLHAVHPSVPIVVFSVERSPELVRSALRCGASGYLGKDSSPARIIAALHATAAGLAAIGTETIDAVIRSANLTERPLDGSADPAAAPATPSTPGASVGREPLTPRELELLRYLAEGYTNKEVARVMVLAEDTVKKGVQSLIAKLGATDRTHAVVLALRSGVID